MVNIFFINPLSNEGRERIREQGSIDGLMEDNPDLIEVVTRDIAQEISKDEDIPKNYIELALKRVEWYIKRRYDRDFNYKKYSFLFNENIARFDLIAFYLLSQAVAVKFGPFSRESRIIVESQGNLIQGRLEEINPTMRRELVDGALLEFLQEESVNWTFFEDLIGSHKIQLTSLILDQGQVILDREDFLESFAPALNTRDPEKMYRILIGEKLKEIILIRLIMQATEDYISDVYEKARVLVEPNPLLLELAERLTQVLTESSRSFSYKGGTVEGKASPYQKEAFPPCVKMAMDGIKSGGRNDGIVLFLTPYLSYARLYPDIFKQNISVKISDRDPNLEVVQNEILPAIYEAADKCHPPLFEDQPQEKININAKLGFGMHESLKPEHEGDTKWYTPMSCEKIKLHLPHLCRPDEDCKKIGNPLTYYLRKQYLLRNQNKTSPGEE